MILGTLKMLQQRRQRKRQKAIDWPGKTTPLHVQHTFLHISLPSLLR